MTESDDEQISLEQPVELPDNGAPPSPHRPQSPQKRRLVSKILVTLIIIVLLGAVGYGIWYFITKRNQPSSQPPTNTSTVTKTTNDSPDSTQLKTYKSDTLGLQISYPATWKPTETEGGITVTSPDFSYQTTDKGQVSGNFRVYIRQGARPIDGKYIGAGMVTQPSEKLVYSSPGSTQRKDTNLTQFGAPTSDHFTFFMVTGDYQLKKDDQLGASYGHEADTYILVGGYGTKDQKDDLNVQSVPASNYQSTHAYTQGINILKSLKLN